jgi:hypothetical protein
MSIIARYQSDIEQIISNFVPYCDPYIVVSWKLPTTENTTYEREIRTIIEWSGSLNIQYPVELNANQLARVTCDTSFTIKGWLFKQINESAKDILKINTTHIPSLLSEECIVYNNITNAGAYDSAPSVEVFTINGSPKIISSTLSMLTINHSISSYPATIFGDNFTHATAVYLKSIGSSVFSTNESLDPFANTSLSATLPAFIGHKINNFTINSNNSITFNIPNYIVRNGAFDVVVTNKAGCGILSQNARAANVPEKYQPVWVNGIQVIS